MDEEIKTLIEEYKRDFDPDFTYNIIRNSSDLRQYVQTRCQLTSFVSPDSFIIKGRIANRDQMGLLKQIIDDYLIWEDDDPNIKSIIDGLTRLLSEEGLKFVPWRNLDSGISFKDITS